MIAGRLFRIAALLCLTAAPAQADDKIAPEELARVKALESARVQTVQGVYGAVVAIFGTELGKGGGSGVLIDEAGFVLTNFHVVQAAGKKGKAGLADGKLYDWTLWAIDPGGDLAMIRLLGRDKFPTAPLGDSRTVRQGQWTMAMGNPFLLAEDYKPTVTLGIVSGTERFQAGQGGLLVYGNCIQVDTSINPGNSGGPLFDMAGRLIGINGRCSFEERGRVNVGVGYSISVEQCKNFLPELLAAKFCLHGTLDCTFRDEENRVICNQINEDSEIAKKGLRLGDQLISFEGMTIQSANQFLNLITTLPAGWPATIAFRGPLGPKTVVAPLKAVTIKMPQSKPQPKIELKPTPGEDKTPADKKKPLLEKIKSVAKIVKPEEPPPEPGKVIDSKHNREACDWLLKRCEAAAKIVPAAQRKKMELEGADKIDGQRAFRMWIDDAQGMRHTIWLSVCGPDERLQIRLLKTDRAAAPAEKPQEKRTEKKSP